MIDPTEPAERIACALERIADALETTNAANLAGVIMDPASPGRLGVVQAITDVIVARFRLVDRRRKESLG